LLLPPVPRRACGFEYRGAREKATQARLHRVAWSYRPADPFLLQPSRSLIAFLFGRTD
jgi:hypothetical protein